MANVTVALWQHFGRFEAAQLTGPPGLPCLYIPQTSKLTSYVGVSLKKVAFLAQAPNVISCNATLTALEKAADDVLQEGHRVSGYPPGLLCNPFPPDGSLHKTCGTRSRAGCRAGAYTESPKDRRCRSVACMELQVVLLWRWGRPGVLDLH